MSLWLPASTLGTGPGIKGFVGFSFQLERLGGKILGEAKILQDDRREFPIMCQEVGSLLDQELEGVGWRGVERGSRSSCGGSETG